MSDQGFPIVTSTEGLREQLLAQGIAGAAEASIVEGLDGEQDAAILFPHRNGTKVFGCGFDTATTSIEAAQQILRETAPTLREGLKRTIQGRTLTFFYE